MDGRCCPDQYVGEIAAIEAANAFAARLPVADRPEGQAVVLVLESPHIDEFVDQPGPAKGPSGRHIVRFIRQVRGLEQTGKRSLLLVNAIQYPCSLGARPQVDRDKVFSALWAQGGRDNFMGRMRDAFRAGDMVVCACTKGMTAGPSELRHRVHDAIRQALPEVTPLRRIHPSKWNMPTKRGHEWPAD